MDVFKATLVPSSVTSSESNEIGIVNVLSRRPHSCRKITLGTVEAKGNCASSYARLSPLSLLLLIQ